MITLHDEEINDNEPYEIFDPEYTWKRKTVTNFRARKLMVKIFDKGRCVYESPDLHTIRDYCREQVDTLWEEVKRFENPHRYYVDLSQKLWDIRAKLLHEYSMR